MTALMTAPTTAACRVRRARQAAQMSGANLTTRSERDLQGSGGHPCALLR